MKLFMSFFLKSSLLLGGLLGVLGPQLIAQDAAVLTAWENLETYKREREANEEMAINALLEAKKNIDGAILNDVTLGKSKTWKRRGDVYWFIYVDKSPRLLLHKEGSNDIAATSFLKALVVEKKSNGNPKIEDAPSIAERLLTLANDAFKAGIDYTNSSKFDLALNRYDEAYRIFEGLLSMDSKNEGIKQQMGYLKLYGSKANLMKGEKEKGLALAKEAKEMLPKDSIAAQNLLDVYLQMKDYAQAKSCIAEIKSTFKPNADIHMIDIRLSFITGDIDRAGALIAEGKEKFPDRKADIVLEEVNFHLEKQNDEEALKAIDVAIESFQDSKDMEILKVLYFNKGVVNDKIVERLEKEDATAHAATIAKRREAAKSGYEKTLELDGGYSAAYVQLANGYIQKANGKINDANALDLNETDKYDKLKAESLVLFEESAKLLEKGLEVEQKKENPDAKRVETIRNTLMQVYQKTGNVERYKELKSGK